MSPLLWLAALGLAGKSATPTNHPDWRWHTLQTEHFAFHYATSKRADLSAEPAAQRLAAEADEIWLRMGDALDWFPTERIAVVVVDDTDSLRAWSWPLRGLVVISGEPGIELARTRSSSDLLVDVFAHELAHVFTHKRAGAVSERIGFGIDAWTHVEGDGWAVGARVPVGANAPQWWSEGGAEFLSNRVGHGWWSTDRQAGLRVAALEDRLLSWDELQVATDKGDVGDGELAYQQGNAFFRWLEQTCGEGTFARLHAASAERMRVEPMHVLREVTGRAPRELFEAFVADLEQSARDRGAARQLQGPVVGEELSRWGVDWEERELQDRDAWERRRKRDRERERTGSGSWNLYAEWSSDGTWLAEHRAGWIRVRQTPERAWPALSDRAIAYGVNQRTDAQTRELDLWIPAQFGSSFAFVPGRDQLIVSGAIPFRGPDFDGYQTHQLVRVDLEPTPRAGKRRAPAHLEPALRHTHPIPGTERGSDPTVSATGELAFVRNRGGGSELVAMGLDGSRARVLASLPGSGRFASPSWAPDGERLVVAVHNASRNDLWVVAKDGALRPLTDDGLDEADPFWGPDGIWFTADLDGFRDVFRMDPEATEVRRITRVLGAAGTPSVTPDGNLLYANRSGHGWKTMALRRDGFDGGRVEGFSLNPDQPPVQIAVPEPRPARRYSAIADAPPFALTPELRVDLDPSGTGVMAGAWILARDPAEQLELSLEGLAGTDALASAGLTTRFTGPDFGLWAQWEDDRRLLVRERIARVHTGAAGLSMDWALVPDSLALLAELSHRAIGMGGLEPRPIAASWVGLGGLRLGDGSYRWELAESGGRVLVAGLGAVTQDRVAGEQVGWWRGQLDADGAAAIGPVVADGRLVAGGSSPGVPAVEWLRAGGDAPSALRLSVLEPSVPFVGFAPRSIAGEALVVLGCGLTLPVRDLRKRIGPVYLDDLGLRLGADVGRAWGPDRPTAPVLFDAVAELRLAANAADQGWNSVVRGARGFGQPVPTGDPTQARTSEGPWRIQVGIGTGW